MLSLDYFTILGSAHLPKNTSPPSRVILWAVPRSASTTLLLSMSQSPDTVAWFEPYLFASIQERFEETPEIITMQQKFKVWLASMFVPGGYDIRQTSYEWVKTKLESYHKEDQQNHLTNIFVKDMVKGITGKFQFIPDGYTHTFLIRHPLRVFTLYKRKHNLPGSAGENKGLKLTQYSEKWIPPGYFFKEIHDLVTHVRDVLQQKVVIIDTDDLLEDPDNTLRAYCHEIGMTFDASMLHWDPADGVLWKWMVPKDTSLTWAWRTQLYGYNPTHKTSFSRHEFGERMLIPDRTEVDEDVLVLADASMGYYDKLYQHRLKTKPS